MLGPVKAPKFDKTTLKFGVYNTEGKPTMTMANYKISYPESDVALIEADFSGFNKVDFISDTFTFKNKDKLTSCGFANGIVPLRCTNGEFLGTWFFHGEMTAFVAKGMSGGPVLNKEGKVVGVNSSRFNDVSRFGILFGLMSERIKDK